jgi:hypothetical protein
MTHRSCNPVGTAISITIVVMAAVSAPAQEARDKAIAGLAGEWQISYTNGSIRLYSIDKQGFVTFKSEQETRKGRVFRKSEALLLERLLALWNAVFS